MELDAEDRKRKKARKEGPPTGPRDTEGGLAMVRAEEVRKYEA